jgi:hypothetical protein
VTGGRGRRQRGEVITSLSGLSGLSRDEETPRCEAGHRDGRQPPRKEQEEKEEEKEEEKGQS